MPEQAAIEQFWRAGKGVRWQRRSARGAQGVRRKQQRPGGRPPREFVYRQQQRSTAHARRRLAVYGIQRGVTPGANGRRMPVRR